MSTVRLGMHRSLRALACMMLFACSTGSCKPDPQDTHSQPADTAETQARSLLDPALPLPSRAETVSIADAVAIASSKTGATQQGAALAQLAGDLRARLFRLDQTKTDGREAIELYAAAGAALRAASDGDPQDRLAKACEADRRRALLIGEMAQDAAISYRELYLVSRRYATLFQQATTRNPCLTALDVALAQASAFRPSGEALHALEQEGHRLQEAALSATATPLTTSSSAVSASAQPTQAASAQLGRDLVLTPRTLSKPTGPVKITSIEHHGSDKAARVVIELSAPTTFEVGTLAADETNKKDARIFIDVTSASARGIAREIEVGGVLRRVRIGAQEKGTRIVLDLADALHRRIFYLPDPFRIVADVSTRSPLTEEKIEASGQRQIRRVAIDPGHGGNDTGAVGPTGLREKDVTLDIAHRVAPILARELKIETLLTRDSDVFVPLDLRTARANAFHADLFISIHCNASADGLARGVQTFSLDAAREPERASAQLVARENASTSPATPHPASDATSTEMAAILSGLNVPKLAERSRHFADLLQRAALASLTPRYPDSKDQGVKAAAFYVLTGADMPAALFETAFISNPEDETRLGTADFRQKMADAIANAIRAYHEGK